MKSLPIINVSKSIKKKIGNKPVLLALVDIFDEDFWSSKVSIIGNSILVFLILLSTIEILLSSERGLSEYENLLRIIDIVTSLIFTVEILLRINLAKYKDNKYRGTKGIFKYLFSFYGIIDILSIIPFWGLLLGININASFKIFRIFRIWRIVRFIPSFEFIGNAVSKKADEILVTLLGVLLLSTTISALLYYAEMNAGFNTFSSILNALQWSIGKYTGDYGAIAVSVPETYIGRFLATLNGILGIALFALPAGLLGSAFIDELVEQKIIKQIKNRNNQIDKYFENNSKKNKLLFKYHTHMRYVTFDTLQARILLSDEEIIECVRNSENLRFRSMKSAENIKYNDVKILERYWRNTSYGCYLQKETKFFVINSMGASERCISHFTYTIADVLNFNYISRENRFETQKGKPIKSNFSECFADYKDIEDNELPKPFHDYMEDLMSINSDDYIFVICSAASGRADFIIEYGNRINEVDIVDNISTIYDRNFLDRFILRLRKNSQGYSLVGDNKKHYKFDFKVEVQTIGSYDKRWISKTINRFTGANVITIYVNINILTGENPYYYSGLGCLINSIKETISE